MPYRSNPVGSLLLVLGAGLSAGAMAWDDAGQLLQWPVIVVTVMATLVVVLALAALLGGGRVSEAVGLVVALLLAGYVANQVVLSVWLSREFRDGVALASAGSAVLIVAGCVTLHALVRVRTPQARTAAMSSAPARMSASVTTPAANPGAATAPPGWYPDPAGSAGQRYWDGSAWGQTYQ
jgi:hypothetical protein